MTRDEVDAVSEALERLAVARASGASDDAVTIESQLPVISIDDLNTLQVQVEAEAEKRFMTAGMALRRLRALLEARMFYR